MVYIYGLVDPRDGATRYIGKSCDLKRRLQSHLCPCNAKKNFHKSRWINSLVSAGLRPEIVVLEEIADDADWQAAERRWIEDLRAQGHDLTNTTSGGEGGATMTGRKRSAESIKRTAEGNSRSRKGKPVPHLHTPEAIEKRAAKIKEAWARRKAAGVETRVGRTASPETREKLKASRKSEKAQQQWSQVLQDVAARAKGRKQPTEQVIHRTEKVREYWATVPPEQRRAHVQAAIDARQRKRDEQRRS